jgi:RTX calcium-binding nonapeptide repeat (4 copies)
MSSWIASSSTTSFSLGPGNTILQIGNGNDTVTAGNGNDTVTAGNGNDTITLGNSNEASHARGARECWTDTCRLGRPRARPRRWRSAHHQP